MSAATTLRLPGALAELARVTSIEVALRIAQRHGGTRLYVARKPERNALAKLVGTKSAAIITEALGGRHYDIPKATGKIRTFKARGMRERGRSYEEIAAALRITVGHAARIARGVVPTPEGAARIRTLTRHARAQDSASDVGGVDIDELVAGEV